MSLFEAKIIDAQGSQLLTISAPDLHSAYSLAEQSGKVVYCKKRFSPFQSMSLTSAERELLLSQLAFLTASGMGTGAALRTLQSNYSGRLAQVAGELLAYIEAGEGLDTAMEQLGSADIPAATQALVRAGYRAGQGSEGLEAAAGFESELRELKKTSGADMIISSVSFLGAVVLILATVFYIGPSILATPLISGAGDAVDVEWALILGKVTALFMFLLLAGVAFLTATHLLVRQRYPLWADRLTLRVPLWRDVVLSRERYLGFFSIQALMGPSISLEQVFDIAAKGTPKGMLRTELERAGQAVRDGEDWLPHLNSLSPIDKAALSGAADRRQLAHTFKRLAGQYRDRYSRSRETATNLLRVCSALTLTIAGGVLFALSVLPMLQASSSIL